MNSPQPQPMSSTDVGGAEVCGADSRRIILCARSSERGPWKVSRVNRGGSVVSSMSLNITEA